MQAPQEGEAGFDKNFRGRGGGDLGSWEPRIEHKTRHFSRGDFRPTKG